MKVAAAISLLLATVASAQVRESVTVEVIEVPVYVTAPDGQPIRGLSREAFQLLVNGKRVPIEFFDAVEYAAPAGRAIPPAEEPRRPARERRLYMLLFDTFFSNPGKLARAQRAAEFAIDRANPATDLFAVATYSANKGVQFVTPFLSDRTVTRRAVHTLTLSTVDPFGMAMSPSDRSAWLAAAPEGKDFDKDIGKAGPVDTVAVMGGGAAFQNLSGDFQRHYTDDFLENLGDLAPRLSSLEGQKHVLLFSSGFKASLIHGGRNPVPATALSGGGFSVSSLRLLNEMSRSFAAAGVVLDTVDIDGIPTVPASDSTDSLGMLARATGGDFVHNRNDLGQALTDLTTTQRVVYILGFNRRDARGGTIAVRVNGVPRATRLSYRNGFGAAEKKKDVDPLRLLDVLVNGVPQHDITMRLTVAASTAALELRPQEIAPLLSGKTSNVDTLLYIFDAQGSAVAGYQKQIAFDAIVGAGKAPIIIEKSFDLPPGHYVARAVARIDGTTLVGSAGAEFTVE